MPGPDRLDVPGATRRGDARHFGESRGNGIRGMPKHGATASAPGAASDDNDEIPTAGLLATGDLTGNPPPAFPLASARQELFCLEYLKDMKGTQAAIRAGYSRRSATSQACNMLAIPAISARIAQLMAERALRLRFDADGVILRLCAVVERCMQTAPILDHRGEPVLVELANRSWVPGYEFNAIGALRGLELLGRHLGLFSADRQRRETGLSVEELRRLADERQANDPRYAWMKTLDTEIDELREEWKPPAAQRGEETPPPSSP